MGSITIWNRLEPRARSGDLAEALAARVRDPAWFLTRQWQLGEFQAEDAASPAYLQLRAVLAPIYGWRADQTSDVSPLPPGAPIEPAVTAEPTSPHDLLAAVEIGHELDRQLVGWNLPGLRAAFLAAYPIPDGPDDDPATARLRSFWRGRVVDGVALVAAALGPPGPGDLPAGVPDTIDEHDWRDAGEIVLSTRLFAEQVHGVIGTADPVAWRPDRLDHALTAYATGDSGTATALAAAPGATGDLAWHGFDHAGDGAPPPGLTPPNVTTVKRTVLPGPVKFRGMPSDRFWDFEDSRVVFGDLRPDRRNLATMLLMDFMLVHGTDWFLVPFEQPVGTICTATMTMFDVFGGETEVPRAGATSSDRWSMFSLATSGGYADGLLIPDSAAAAVHDGAPLEQVRFLRDENANLVWAVEHAVEGPRGAARLRHEEPAPPAVPAVSTAPLAYRVQTQVPAHWIPFQPTKLPHTDEIALERAALLGPEGVHPALPRGKVLQPPLPHGTNYRIREEEVPREGRRVQRKVRRARGVDGSTHVWVARSRGIGTGEGWSGLAFDRAEETVPPEE